MRVGLVALLWLVAACKAPPPYVPRDSPLADVELGMSEREVVHLLGRPDRVYHYTTAKVLIPFYLGADAGEIVYSYAGRGRILFAAGPAHPWPRVIRVEDDPSERGFGRPGRRPPPRYDRDDRLEQDHDDQRERDRDDRRELERNDGWEQNRDDRDRDDRWETPPPPR
jgi:hypothetical protein